MSEQHRSLGGGHVENTTIKRIDANTERCSGYLTIRLVPVFVPHEVLLLRHGETDWNKEGRMQGRIDRPLTARGQDQARRQGDLLATLASGPDRVEAYVSPLERAQQTARIALRGRDFVTDPRLTEMGFGTWEGTTHAERMTTDPALAATAQNLFETYAKAPGAEPLDQVVARCSDFLREITGPVVVVSHRMTLTVMQAVLTGQSSRMNCDFEPPQGGILWIKGGQSRVYQG
ncbi:MAG: histidine phosphatase family protein [Pseudomonadota bacterium]